MEIILIPYFEPNGSNSYPSGVSRLFNRITFNGEDYWIALGLPEEEKGVHKYSDYQSYLKTKTGIRKITKRAFLQRFTQPERTAIRKSTDDIVIDVHEDLKLASFVDLDLQDLRNVLAYFVSISILVPERVDELLVDGTEEEKYRGV